MVTTAEQSRQGWGTPEAPGSHADLADIGTRIIAEVHGGVPLTSWPYVSTEDIFVVAAMSEPLSPSGALAIATSYLGHRVRGGDYSPGTVEKATQLLVRFIAYAENRYHVTDVEDLDAEHVHAWIHAPVLGPELRTAAARTRDIRRWALGLFFRTLRGLNLYHGDPLVDADPTVRPPVSFRPLLDAELEKCRRYSRSSVRDTLGPVRIALAESMATASEVPTVMVADYDATEQRLWLPGTESRLMPRWVNLLDSAAEAVERRITRLGSSDPEAVLAYTGHASGYRAGSATSMALRKILDRAGLSDDLLLRPGSFRAWGGRRLYDETQDIEEVALRLGLRKLDSARHLIGLPDAEADAPPPHRSNR